MPDTTLPQHDVAYEYYQKKDYRRYKTELENILRDAPDDYDARYGLGVAFGELGDLDRSIQEFNRALSLRPGSALVYHSLGIVYTRKAEGTRSHRDWLSAVSCYEKLLTGDPSHPDVVSGLAVALWHAGEREQALALVERAVTLISCSLDDRLMQCFFWAEGRMFWLSVRRGHWRRAWQVAGKVRKAWPRR